MHSNHLKGRVQFPRIRTLPPSVTTSGCTLVNATNTPLTNPARTAITRVITSASHIFMPFIHSTPMVIEESPIMEPTETSIPPVIKTNVIGIAASAI